jgi:quinol monooxygenase YgiN
MKDYKWTLPFFVPVTVMILFMFVSIAAAQDKKEIVHLAKLVIDYAQLEKYKALLKEEIETSFHVEQAVLSLYAVSEKANPRHMTILGIYADREAYKMHLKTKHFIKYKTGIKNMVGSLELIEADLLLQGMRMKRSVLSST